MHVIFDRSDMTVCNLSLLPARLVLQAYIGRLLSYLSSVVAVDSLSLTDVNMPD